MPECLREAYSAGIEAGAIRSMQNKLMAAEPQNQAGALLLGDSYNMRHPLTGGGMTVALNDVALLCDMLQACRSPIFIFALSSRFPFPFNHSISSFAQPKSDSERARWPLNDHCLIID